MPNDVEYETGDDCGGLPEECDEKGVVGSFADTCRTCPDLCCLENRNEELINKVTAKTQKKLVEKLNR
jgi:hypothetical protein